MEQSGKENYVVISKIFFLLTMARVVIMVIFCVTSMRKKGSFYSRQKGEFILGNNSWKQ